MCWDLSYSGFTGTPTARTNPCGGAGVNGCPIVVPFRPFPGPTSATGCAAMDQTPTPSRSSTIRPTSTSTSSRADFPNGAIRGQLSAGPTPAGEAHLLPAPLRAYDSRDADGPLALNTTRTVSLANGKDGAGRAQIAVPPGATAAIVTLTVTDTVGNGGFLKLYSAALATPPSTSSINWFGPGQNLAVTTQVAVDSAGQVKVTDGANPTNFLIDVIGYLF